MYSSKNFDFRSKATSSKFGYFLQRLLMKDSRQKKGLFFNGSAIKALTPPPSSLMAVAT